MPDIPTIAESGVPGYEVNPWFGVLLPARAQPALVVAPEREILKVLQHARHARTLRGGRFRSRSAIRPAQFAAYIKSEQVEVGESDQDAGIRADCGAGELQCGTLLRSNFASDARITLPMRAYSFLM